MKVNDLDLPETARKSGLKITITNAAGASYTLNSEIEIGFPVHSEVISSYPAPLGLA